MVWPEAFGRRQGLPPEQHAVAVVQNRPTRARNATKQVCLPGASASHGSFACLPRLPACLTSLARSSLPLSRVSLTLSLPFLPALQVIAQPMTPEDFERRRVTSLVTSHSFSNPFALQGAHHGKPVCEGN